MRLGLLGGTFDPIHLGHLRAAEAAREALALDAVWFVPAGVPPHRALPAAPALDRYAMVALATSDNADFAASDVEIRRSGPSYTVETLEAIRAEHPGSELVLVVGADTFAEMGSWREPERLRALCQVAVVGRAGAGPPPGEGEPGVRAVAASGLPIAASEVRALLRQRRSVRYLVPPAVADYIEKRALYR